MRPKLLQIPPSTCFRLILTSIQVLIGVIEAISLPGFGSTGDKYSLEHPSFVYKVNVVLNRNASIGDARGRWKTLAIGSKNT